MPPALNDTSSRERDLAVYRASGFTGSSRLGVRPAVLVIDLILGFTDPARPLGAPMDDVVARCRSVLDAARESAVLTVFTTIAYDEPGRAASAWVRKVPSLGELMTGSASTRLDPRLGRRGDEPVVPKQGASAFFGTPLHSLLQSRGTDTVFVLGATTSGCVRATVVDCVQYGYGTFVVTDCVADRVAAAHDANLFDMTMKYADEITAESLAAYLRSAPKPARSGSLTKPDSSENKTGSEREGAPA